MSQGNFQNIFAADFITAGNPSGNINYEPQRINMWKFYISTPPKNLASGWNASLFQISCRECPIPQPHNEPVVVPYGNETRKVPGRYMVENADISFTEFVDANTIKMLWAWRQEVYPGLASNNGSGPGDGSLGLAANIKAEGRVRLYGPDATDTTMHREFRLIGLWPTNDPVPQGLSAEGNGGMVVKVTFSVDKIIPYTNVWS